MTGQLEHGGTTYESDQLRAWIRSGDVVCRCKQRREFPLTVMFDYHHPDCSWKYAVDAIYVREASLDA
jgi:hypothetical protein